MANAYVWMVSDAPQSNGFMTRAVRLRRIGQNPSEYRVRLMGTRASEIFGELQGKCLHDTLPAEPRARWTATIDKTLREQRPLRFLGRTTFDDQLCLQTELFLSPLLDDDLKASLVLAVISVQAGVTTTDPQIDTGVR